MSGLHTRCSFVVSLKELLTLTSRLLVKIFLNLVSKKERIMYLGKIKKAVKKVLANSFIRKFVNKYNYYLYKVLSISKIIAIPYHFIFSRFFDKEMFAFTNAVYKYNSKVFDVLSSNIIIRRNIRRKFPIDKISI